MKKNFHQSSKNLFQKTPVPSTLSKWTRGTATLPRSGPLRSSQKKEGPGMSIPTSHINSRCIKWGWWTTTGECLRWEETLGTTRITTLLKEWVVLTCTCPTISLLTTHILMKCPLMGVNITNMVKVDKWWTTLPTWTARVLTGTTTMARNNIPTTHPTLAIWRENTSNKTDKTTKMKWKNHKIQCQRLK